MGLLGTTYVLTGSGTVVHYAGCWHARVKEVMFGNVVPWHWAQKHGPLRIAALVEQTNMHACASCRPLSNPAPRGRRRA